jgi:hypothetical protein
VIRIRERAVLELRVPRAQRSPQARARDASETLTHVLELPGPDVVRTEPREGAVTLLVGETPIVELSIGLAFALRFPGPIGETVVVSAAAATLLGELVAPAGLRAALRRSGEASVEPAAQPVVEVAV